MIKFNDWLQKRDPELTEGIKKALDITGAIALPMAGAVGGGAAGLAVGGMPGALAGWIGGKYIGAKAAEKLFPKGVVDAMRK